MKKKIITSGACAFQAKESLGHNETPYLRAKESHGVHLNSSTGIHSASR